ncbi:P2Y purinoceptor 6-like [Brachyhypopomus gauderio]|uniref:P2Y purinoceptor 6-like n=1 Tax=Brachyhypopomus gauderio TaxID=698409 RepID=UPI0040421399
MLQSVGPYCPVWESYKWVYLPVAYSLVFVAGLTLNGALLILICSQRRSWSGSVVLLANLAVSDLLYVLSLPLLIGGYAMEDSWPFGDAACKAARFLFYANLHCSTVFAVCASVHRSLGVCNPVVASRYRTKRVAVITSCLVWVLVSAELAPTLAFSHTGLINNRTVCFDMTNPAEFRQYFPYGLVLAVLGFLVPFVIILICNCYLMRALSRTGEMSHAAAEARAKSSRTLGTACLLLVICLGPYQVTRIVYMFVRVYMPEECGIINVVMVCYKVWRPLVSFNCCVNPIVWFVFSDRKRQQLMEALCRRSARQSVWTVRPRLELSAKSAPGTMRIGNASLNECRD